MLEMSFYFKSNISAKVSKKLRLQDSVVSPSKVNLFRAAICTKEVRAAFELPMFHNITYTRPEN